MDRVPPYKVTDKCFSFSQIEAGLRKGFTEGQVAHAIQCVLCADFLANFWIPRVCLPIDLFTRLREDSVPIDALTKSIVSRHTTVCALCKSRLPDPDLRLA